MANVFVSLPVPSGNGAGAATSTATLAGKKTVIVNVPTDFQGNIDVQFNASAAAGVWQSLGSTGNNKKFTAKVVAEEMRVVVSNYTGGTAPTVQVGAEEDTSVAFFSVAVLGTYGAGASVDVEAAGVLKTLTVNGDFNGSLDIQASDDNLSWQSVRSFTGQGSFTSCFAAKYLRTVRSGTFLPATGTPVVSLGAGDDSGGGGGGGGGSGNPGSMLYSADGTEGTDFTVTWPTPRASANYSVVALSQGGGGYVVAIDIPHADITATDFRVITSAALAFGDAIAFHAIDLPAPIMT